MRESLEAVKNGESIVVYPEDSAKGYLAQLEGFFAGFAVFAEHALKRGVDLPIVVSYFRKEQKIFVFDKPIKYSNLIAEYGNKEKVIEYLLNRCNELGVMDLSEYLEEKVA